MTDFEGSRNISCKKCGIWFNTAEGMQCDCEDEEENNDEEDKCEKDFCMKQVNPRIPNLYFGVPFQYDENWGGCYLCGLGFGAAYVLNDPTVSKPKLITRRSGFGLL